jgi:hypothetical protein
MNLPDSFSYSNPFSSLDVRASSAAHSWPEWQPADFVRGFCLGEHAVSFSTLTDDNYEVTVVESDDELVPEDCVFAVKAPLDSSGPAAHIRGGCPDVDVPTTWPCQSVMFLELVGSRVLLRLGREPVSGVKVLQAASMAR